jgi:hypothetical protein
MDLTTTNSKRSQARIRGREGHNNKGKSNTILKNNHEEYTKDDTKEKTIEGTKENLKEKSCNSRLTNKKNNGNGKKTSSITIGTTKAMRIRGGEGNDEEALYQVKMKMTKKKATILITQIRRLTAQQH